ncbi:MAG: hypothetical protein JW702_06720 [Clostridiales bacterium]|nr:hypothetical protein [Clostridiales bacterium]
MSGKASPDELFSVLQSLEYAFQTIDLRIVAVKTPTKKEWQNVVTSVIARTESQEVLQKEQKKLPVIKNNDFSIFLHTLPYPSGVFDRISLGEIKLISDYGDSVIKYRKFDPLKLKVHSTKNWFDEEYSWVLRASANGVAEERKEFGAIIQNQNIEAKQLGYSNIEQLLNEIVGTEYRDGTDFIATLSSFARIQNVSFEKNQVFVEVKRPTLLNGLQLNLTVERANNFGMFKQTQKIHPRVLHVQKPKNEENYTLVQEAFNIKEVLPYDRVEAELILRSSGLTIDKMDKKAPLDDVVEPFLKTFDSFCPLEEFKSLLFDPYDYGRPPEQIFEIAVSWLLSLAGFSIIYFGKNIKVPKSPESKKFRERQFDILLAKSGLAIGCADIIAYENNEKILLVDCDIGELDASKIQRLISTRKHIEALLKINGLRIIPVLISPKQLATHNDYVKIVDKTVLETLLKEIEKGNLESARSIFG